MHALYCQIKVQDKFLLTRRMFVIDTSIITLNTEILWKGNNRVVFLSSGVAALADRTVR